MANQNVFNLIEVALAVVKDQTISNCIRKIEDAQREVVLAEAEKGRGQSKELVRSIAKIDIELIKLKNDFSKGKGSLDSKSIEAIEDLIAYLEKDLLKKRKSLVNEKNRL